MCVRETEEERRGIGFYIIEQKIRRDRSKKFVYIENILLKRTMSESRCLGTHIFSGVWVSDLVR